MSYNPFTRESIGQSLGRQNVNATGSNIPKGTPVIITSTGLDLVDVSSETSVDAFAGVLSADAINAQNGNVVSSGSIENLVTSFAVGSMIYINKIGVLTSTKPTLGANGFGEGDFVIKIGMIAKNSVNPANKDLLVSIQIMGVL